MKENIIQKKIKDKLTLAGWYVVVLHGSMYQSGMPDLYCTHSRYGVRLVEVKRPDRKGDVFTPAQIDVFPKLCANGSNVWVLTGEGDSEIKKLFGPCNWYTFLF